MEDPTHRGYNRMQQNYYKKMSSLFRKDVSSDDQTIRLPELPQRLHYDFEINGVMPGMKAARRSDCGALHHVGYFSGTIRVSD